MASSKSGGLAALRARFEAARGNVAALEALNIQLRGATADALVDLQIEVMAALRALRGGKASLASAPAPAVAAGGVQMEDPVGPIRARARFPRQPLYRYAVTDAEYAALRGRLEWLHARGGLEQANQLSAATFVLYCAEWFRREYDGGGYSWEAPYPALIRTLSDPARKALARDGLAWWGRTPRRTEHFELRLMSLALEGGFPTRLLESRDNARIPLHLERLLARVEAAGTVDEERATHLSQTLGSHLGTYDHEEFHALCAELILAIIRLKAEAAAGAPAGVMATAWLDAAREGWREELPIGLAGDGARRLLDDLVSARAIRLGGGDARAHRLLRWDGDAWRPSVRLGMDGELDLRRTAFRPSDGRLRAHAAGASASVFAGELGLVEPPAEDEQGWLCRPRGGERLTADAPFAMAVEIELRAGANRQVLAWPGGEPLRGEVLLFADPKGATDGAPPAELEFVGQGSVRTRRPRLFCWTPAKSVARPLGGGEAIAPLWSTAEARLFDINQPVRIEPPGDGGHYRIEVGADGERIEQLVIEGAYLRGVESAVPGLPVFAGAPRVQVRRRVDGRLDSAPAGEVRWRRVGDPVWRDWGSMPATHGTIDVVWRDPASNALRDRQRFVATPESLAIRTKARGGAQVAVEVEGPPGWVVRGVDAPGLQVTPTADGVVVAFTGRPSRRLALMLEGPGFEAAPILVRARLAQGGFFRADGRRFENRELVMLDDLRAAVAVCDGRDRLYLSGPMQGDSRLDVLDEAPLWALSEEILRLLSGGRELDDRVRLEFSAGDGPQLSVGRYAAKLAPVRGDGVVKVESREGAAPTGAQRLEWFSILTSRFTLIAEGEGPAPLPPECVGPGVALLREGDRIVGRPTFAAGAPTAPADDWCELQAASLITSMDRRPAAIREIMSQLGDDTAEAAANRAYLRAQVSSLGGLPPSSMDTLKALAADPSALAALIATTTRDAERAAIWALERELPFLWCAIPIETWEAAFGLQRRLLEAQMASLGAKRAADLAAEAVGSAAETLARLESMLRQPLAFAGIAMASDKRPIPSLRAAANAWLSRTADHVDDARSAVGVVVSCFRGAENDLSAWLPDLSAYQSALWEGLDAACAAALAAAGRRLSMRQVLRVRAALAEEPVAFADLYAAALQGLAQYPTLSL